MLERGAELKRNAAREPSYPMVPAGFSCITHDFIGKLLSHQAQCLSASSLWSTFSEDSLAHAWIATTSLPRLKGNQPWRRIPSQPGNSLRLPSAVEAGRQLPVSEGAEGFVIFLPTQFCINMLQNGAAVRNPFNARGRHQCSQWMNKPSLHGPRKQPTTEQSPSACHLQY